MIREINLLRSDPKNYAHLIEPELTAARVKLKQFGKGAANYSITTTFNNGYGNPGKVDTTWHYQNEEEVNALSTLVDRLKRMKPLSILKPDSGIYLAAKKHALDNHKHEWKLGHIGSDASAPWDRILKFSPVMKFGNENIAMSSANPTPRDIVLQLLVDTGIPGYGHRETLLDPAWTHIACTGDNYQSRYHWWLQEFGVIK